MPNSGFIPDDITRDILSRLPSNSLLRFRSVSKSWYSLIYHPDFTGLQFKRASLNPRILFVLEQQFQFQLLDPECLSFNESCLSAPFNFPSETPPEKNSFTYLGSSCGLVCVAKFCHQSRACSFFLWNPFTREIREIPFIPHMNSATCDHFYVESVHGLGYDPVSNDLKLVLWNWVFSINLNSWKSIEFPASLGLDQHASQEDRKATVLNGVFHWLKKSYCSVEIIAFDSTSDRFFNLQIPQIASSPLHDANLFEHGGCLCIFFSLLESDNVMEIRMLKDQAWIHFLKLQIPQVPPTPFHIFPGETFFFPTCISKRSGRVILHNWKHLLRSKKEDETCEEIFNRPGFVCEAFTCVETLVSPNRIICFK